MDGFGAAMESDPVADPRFRPTTPGGQMATTDGRRREILLEGGERIHGE